MNTNRRVIAVLRVSTDSQDVERQKGDIERVKHAHSLTITRTVELEGVSGRKVLSNRDVQRVLADLKRADVDGIAVSALDRLFRLDRYSDFSILDHFRDSGKLIFSAKEGALDPSSDAGFIMSLMSGAQGGLEWRELRRRTSQGKELLRTRGGNPNGQVALPRGVGSEPVKNASGRTIGAKWFYVEPDARRVRKCYDLLFAGVSFQEIAQRVGFASGGGVASLLRNTVWKAIRTFDANSLRPVPLEVPMGITPLITPERWAKAQTILEQKRTTARARKKQQVRKPALGLGLLRCSCGRFHYLRRDYRPNQHDLFYCASRYKKAGCAAASIRRTEVDAAIERAVTEMCDTQTLHSLLKANAARPAPKPRDTQKTERAIARCAADRERLIDLRMKGLITTEEFEARAAKLAADARDLQEALPNSEPALDQRTLAATIASLFAEFRFLAPTDQYTLARRAFVAFDVAEDGSGIAAAVVRGETLAQAYAKNVQRSREPSWQ